MALFEGKTTAERNKMIAAIVFGGVALLLLARLFLGPSTTTTTNTRQANTNRAQRPAPPGARASAPGQSAPADDQIDVPPQPIEANFAPPNTSEAGRNIFAYYVRPAGPPKPAAVEPTLPPATPEPTPPLLLASIAPQSRYARTADFQLQVSGDKFTPETRVYVDGQEVPTQFASAQQLTANVPAALVASPGVRQIMARTPDNQLYSNPTALNVTQPPVPNYTFVGFLDRQRRNGETALLKDQKNELLSVQTGDIVGGRFRVAAITQRAVDLVDKDLNIKHTLPLAEGRTPATGPGRGVQPPPPPASSEEEGEEP